MNDPVLRIPRTGTVRRAQHSPAIAAIGMLLVNSGLAAEPEQIVVVGERVYPASDVVAPATGDVIDTAELLQRMPGADFNSNGSLTGLAQYRGLFGDRVNVSIDGLRALTGGPNAMDSPLSYASPLLLDHLSLERGIASVWGSTESLGGHINAGFDRGSFAETSDFGFDGDLLSRYESNGAITSTAARMVTASDSQKFALLAERDRGDSLEYPGGVLTPTRLEREHVDLSYGYRGKNSGLLAYVGQLDTINTGTPALPMDIAYVKTDMYGIRFDSDLGATTLTTAFSYSDVDHVMGNFALRTPPASPMAYRSTRARGDGLQWRIGTLTEIAKGDLRLGIDGETSNHTATVTNPNDGAFVIDNFNNARRDIVGLYGQWNQQAGPVDIEAGVRSNRVSMNSGEVSASIPAMNPMMQMMGMNATVLADTFNNGDRDQTRNNIDAVFKIGRVLNESRSIYLELGRKTRPPSYQEAYLWLPMQSTGGLADGRSYIGNAALKSEVSYEINIGTNWRSNNAWFGPQAFYKEISGYIQGVPSTNAVANQVSMMMSGSPALEFSNTDARIYGVDLAWGYYLSDAMTVQGVLTYVRGKRTDVDDDLYRLAPLNGRISFSYEKLDWLASVDLVAYSSQDNVAAYNDELHTSGYGIVNSRVQWSATQSLLVSASIENLFDQRYQPHLGGVNRVSGVDVGLGERLFGQGRSLHFGITYSW
jgi:iron complex outermembrane receptor protein